MNSLSIIFLVVVGVVALIFVSLLFADYFSKNARAARRRKRHQHRKMKSFSDKQETSRKG